MTEESSEKSTKKGGGKGVQKMGILVEYRGHQITFDANCFTVGKVQKKNPDKGLQRPAYTTDLEQAISFLRDKTFKEKAIQKSYQEGNRTLNDLHDLIKEHNSEFKEAMSKAFE